MLDPIREDITDEAKFPSALLCEHLGKSEMRLRRAGSALFDEAGRGPRYPRQLRHQIALYLLEVDSWERIAGELHRRGDVSPDNRPGLQINEARRTVDQVLVELFSTGGLGDDRDDVARGVRAALASVDGSAQSHVQLLTGLTAERIEELGGID